MKVPPEIDSATRYEHQGRLDRSEYESLIDLHIHLEIEARKS